MSKIDFAGLKLECEAGFRLPLQGSHGPSHWQSVERRGLELAAQTGADKDVVRVFAVMHDCQRLTNGPDPNHGKRAMELFCKWRAKNQFGLMHIAPDKSRLLLEALLKHDRGQTSKFPTIATCWDADRLDLIRFGQPINPKLLSTTAARRIAEEYDRTDCGITIEVVREALEQFSTDPIVFESRDFHKKWLRQQVVYHGTTESAAEKIWNSGIMPQPARHAHRHANYTNYVWLGNRTTLFYARRAARHLQGANSARVKLAVFEIQLRALDPSRFRPEPEILAIGVMLCLPPKWNELLKEPALKRRIVEQVGRLVERHGLTEEYAHLWPVRSNWTFCDLNTACIDLAHKGLIPPDAISRQVTFGQGFFSPQQWKNVESVGHSLKLTQSLFKPNAFLQAHDMLHAKVTLKTRGYTAKCCDIPYEKDSSRGQCGVNPH